MHNARHGVLGLRGHAMVLSLPPVLLVWATVAFSIAVVAYTVQGITTNDFVDRATAWTAIGVFILLSITVILGLYAFSVVWHITSRKFSLRAVLCLRNTRSNRANIKPSV